MVHNQQNLKMSNSNTLPLEEAEISQTKETFTLNRDHLRQLRRIRGIFGLSSISRSAYQELLEMCHDLLHQLIQETSIDEASNIFANMKHVQGEKANFYCEGCEQYLCKDCGGKNEHECSNDDE